MGLRIFQYFSFVERRLALRIMKNSPYVVIPLHHRPDLIKQCCDLLNSEWHKSETERLRSLKKSCDKFPTCLILINSDIVVGHCKISLIPTVNDSCIIQSVVIDQDFRSQGLGSILLKSVEEYVSQRGIKSVYLTTKGQEEFYLKNGYCICEPIDLFNYANFVPETISRTLIPICKNEKDIKNKKVFSNAPPPPPMPQNIVKSATDIFTTRTFMVKHLD